jgi:heme/copper-type cytochrome/quinol oxidase subunit 2
LLRRLLLSALTVLAASPLLGAWLLPVSGSSAARQAPSAAMREDAVPRDDGGAPRHYVIEATARDFRWWFREIDSAAASTLQGSAKSNAVHSEAMNNSVASQELRLPVGATVEFHFRSDDYIYLFSVPELGVQQIAAPGLVHHAACVADRPLTHDLQADTLCNFRFEHDGRMGRIIVQ